VAELPATLPVVLPDDVVGGRDAARTPHLDLGIHPPLYRTPFDMQPQAPPSVLGEQRSLPRRRLPRQNRIVVASRNSFTDR